jgi:UDP-glucose 4-epimerase
MIKDKKILITGISGFIGGRFHEAVKRGNTIIGMDEEEGGVTNRQLVLESCRDADYIVHFGALSNINSCAEDVIKAHEVNVTGTLNLLYASKRYGINKFIFISSASIYQPSTMYATTKLIGERYCVLFSATYKVPIVCLRLFNVYGNTNPGAVIPNWVKAIKEGKSPIIYGDGKQTRDFIYVDDVVYAVIQGLESVAPGAYNIGTGIGTSLNRLITEIGRIMGVQVFPEIKESKAEDIRESVAVIPRWFTPKVTLEQGLKKTIEAV